MIFDYIIFYGQISDQSSGMTDRQRRTMLQMQRIRPLVRKQDYYRILGVSRAATQREIIDAYRELARTVAPDKNPGMDTTEIFQSVNEAYGILSDESKRKEYDLGGQRDEFSYDDDEFGVGAEDDFAVDSQATLLTAGVKPSEHFREIFVKIETTAIRWETPSQTLDSWICTQMQKLVTKIDATINRPTVFNSTNMDYCCPICKAVICPQNDVKLAAMEKAHLEENHNAYITRINSIRTALNDPTSIEQVLYSESLPFPLPLKSSLGLDSFPDKTAPPGLLQQLSSEFESVGTATFFSTQWKGYTEWRQFVSFLQETSVEQVGNDRWRISDASFPVAAKGVIPTEEVNK